MLNFLTDYDILVLGFLCVRTRPILSFCLVLTSNMAAKVDEHAIKELLPFLDTNAREDVKYFALDYIVGLTGSDEGKLFLRNHGEFILKIIKLARDSSRTICSKAMTAIVNLSAELPTADIILEYENLDDLVELTLDPKCEEADKTACILSNLTRTEQGSKKLASSPNFDICKIVDAFCKPDHNPHAKLHYLAPMLSNVTQLKEVRDMVLDKSRYVVQRILPFTQYEESLVRRGGMAAVLKNCCFDTGESEWEG